MNVAPSIGDTSARRADWHWLLPQAGRPFNHLVLLGGSPALKDTVLALGIARRVSLEPAPGCEADAVVILAGATGGLDSAVAQLSENGALYWEIDRRTREHMATTPARARKRLSAVGLTPTGSYWVKPGFPRRNMYLPLNAAGAWRWYVDTQFSTPTLMRRAVKRGAQVAASLLKGAHAFAPCYAVTAVRGLRAGVPAMVALARQATQSAHRDHLEAVLLANGGADWSRIVVLLFEPGMTQPTAAIKLPRLAVFNEHIEREHNVLAELDAIEPRPAVPRSSLFRWNGLSISTETCVRGSSLNSRAGSSTRSALVDLRIAAGWLSEFHERTAARTPARDWLQAHLIDGLCARYAELFGLNAAESHLFDAMSRALHSVANNGLPIAWQHADFGPWNVYRDHASTSVIDWEVARKGPALVDLLYFVVHWSRAIAARDTPAARLRDFEQMFLRSVPSGRAACAAQREVAEYMRRLEMPRSLYVFLLAYMLIEQAIDRAERLTSLGRTDSFRRDNMYCGYVAAVAQNADRLFPVPFFQAKPQISRADVTVAVATMDRPEGLARCVRAILEGTILPGELVIVDQSTDDRTADLVSRSNWNDVVPLHYVRQSARGLAASRNAAIARASRPIVAFTDDDCVPDSGWLRAIVTGFNSQENPDAVTGRVLPLGPERPGFYAVSSRASEIRAVYRGRTLPWAVGSGGNTAVTRDCLNRVGGFDERLGAGSPGLSAEDIDLFYRLLRSGATVKYEPEAVVFHERQDAPRRLASRPSYGFGMGAFCALWTRRHDAYALWILSRWCYDRSRALVASCLRRRWRRVYEESLMLRGALHGVAYGLRRAA